MYLVDLVAVILVYCMAMMAGGIFVHVMRFWRHGSAVLRDGAFHVKMYVSLSSVFVL